jgi:hypothetical protein
MGNKVTIEKSSTVLTEGQSTALILAPQFVLKANGGLYSRFGIFVPVAGKTVVTSTDSKFMGSYSLDMEAESKGSLSIGVVAALGYSINLGDNLSIFGELQYSGLSSRSGTYKLTKYELNGKDNLDNLTTYQKEVEYVDEINSSSNNTAYNTNIDPDKPKEELKTTSPFSAVAINVGVIYKF